MKACAILKVIYGFRDTWALRKNVNDRHDLLLRTAHVAIGHEQFTLPVDEPAGALARLVAVGHDHHGRGANRLVIKFLRRKSVGERGSGEQEKRNRECG